MPAASTPRPRERNWKYRVVAFTNSTVTTWRQAPNEPALLVRVDSRGRVPLGAQSIRIEAPPGTRVASFVLHPSGHHSILTHHPNRLRCQLSLLRFAHLTQSGFANYAVRFCQLQHPFLSGFENYTITWSCSLPSSPVFRVIITPGLSRKTSPAEPKPHAFNLPLSFADKVRQVIAEFDPPAAEHSVSLNRTVQRVRFRTVRVAVHQQFRLPTPLPKPWDFA